MLKILVIYEIQERALDICEALTRAGHMVSAVLSDAFQLNDKMQEMLPDVMLIYTDSPSRDTPIPSAASAAAPAAPTR